LRNELRFENVTERNPVQKAEQSTQRRVHEGCVLGVVLFIEIGKRAYFSPYCTQYMSGACWRASIVSQIKISRSVMCDILQTGREM